MEIFKIYFFIIDRGAKWTAQPIETNNPNPKQAVKKYLNKNRYNMDLSTGYKFDIISAVCVAYGTV